MDVAYLGEKQFREAVEATGQVWVARGIHNNIYAEELDETGFSLPVWSTAERVVDYLMNARLVGSKYEPYAVPFNLFIRTWLSDTTKDISEVQINPDGKTTRVLVLTAEECRAWQGED